VIDCDGMNLHQMWNYGLDLASYVALDEPHNVLILNNDIRIGGHFIEKMSLALRSDDSIAIVCPNYDNRSGEGIQYVEDLPMHVGHYDGTEGMCGFAFMLKGEDGYRFPDELAWWCGDNDLRLTAKQSGRRIALAYDAYCQHIDGGNGSGGFREEPMRSIVQRDIRLFHKKWGELAE
jgi:GT2 family glycosyltransferase